MKNGPTTNPSKAMWHGLIDHETFNAANRGRIFVEERENNLLVSRGAIKLRRQKFHPEFNFKGLIRCPECRKPLSASISNQQRKTPSAYYHCSRGHKYIGYPKGELEAAVISFLKDVRLSSDISNLLNRILIEKWQEKRKNLASRVIDSADKTVQLRREKEDVVETMMALRHSPVAIQELQIRLEKIQQQLTTATSKRDSLELSELTVERFLEYASYYFEHLDEMLIDNRSPENQRSLFNLLFRRAADL